jgi:glutathione S-transferase
VKLNLHAAREKIGQRLELIGGLMKGDYLFGLEVPLGLADFAQRMRTRPAVQLALRHEGLE